MYKFILLCIATQALVQSMGLTKQMFSRTALCLKQTNQSNFFGVKSIMECGMRCIGAGEKCVTIAYSSYLSWCMISADFPISCTGATSSYRAVGRCPEPYIYNPHSGTCFRLIADRKPWLEASDSCHSAGEHLMTFPNAASSQWLRNKSQELALDNPDWGEYLWIGGSIESSDYQWNGIVNSTVPEKNAPESDWNDGESNLDVGRNCLCITADDFSGWHNEFCESLMYFVCETDA